MDRRAVDVEALKFELESLKEKSGEEKTTREAAIDKLRDEATELKIQNSQLGSQLEFANANYKVSQSNVEGRGERE